ncbi:TonB-dependent receptor domain-containing protein [Pontibacter sp. HSC-36F09]|uniref:TonB-dependent receptor domain-containing protein n=1 Tax=Pontibacter sp. HSC-36F09 TaxID=2910966 RepID=UPI0020A1E8D5|nr:TonB-dependent receptor [Pontibacter sp. HSC-36F09]MCP2045827.1 outer membrane receptor protein involved in Fe transport [Pontibacter sp. HSC-36F09]
MKQTLLLALLWCLTCTAFAQTPLPTGTIKGIVADSATQAKLDYVTVVMQEAGKNQAVKSTFTKDNGRFELAGLELKQYQLVLSYVGYKTKVLPLPAFTGTTIDLGKLSLVSSARQLKEVQIVTEKLLVEQDIDKITYNVDADPESQTMTALDMLRKVPLLSLDAEDNIKLNGNSNYRVLVNGKTSSLFVRSPKDVFRSMPATTIKSIEVITNPPSKYEAEGVGGIINIITHKKNIGGYNGSVNVQASTPKGTNVGGYLTVKAGKAGFSGYFGTGTYNSPANSNNLYREDKIRQTVLEQMGESRNDNTYQYASGEFSYEMDTLNLFTANFGMNLNTGNSLLTQRVELFDATGALSQAYTRLNNGDFRWKGSDFGADYQRTFKKSKDQLFTLSYRLSNSGNGSGSDFILDPVLNFNGQISQTDNDGSSVEHTMQADYVQPIKKHTLELGVKTIFRLNSSDYFYSNRDPETGTFVIDPNLSNNFEYRQDIYAAYTSLSLKKGDWGLKTGARLEETKLDANFKSSGTVATPDYFNLIPNITLSRKFKGTSTMRLSYTQRIERPSLYYLNPYVNQIDPLNISFGNPKLDPATNNVFNLAYNTFVKGTSINASIFHNFTNNSIQSYTTLGSDTVARTTYGNIGRNQTYGFSLSGNTTLFKKLSINLNSTTNYVKLSSVIGGLPQNNEGFTYNVFGYSSYRFDKGWRASGNIGYSSSRILLQGRSAGYVWNSISVNKQFLKDNKATISFSVNSPFQKNRRSLNEINDPRFTQNQENIFLMRRYSLGFNYRFGKLKGDIARKKRGIKNDDVKGAEQQGGSGAN